MSVVHDDGVEDPLLELLGADDQLLGTQNIISDAADYDSGGAQQVSFDRRKDLSLEFLVFWDLVELFVEVLDVVLEQLDQDDSLLRSIDAVHLDREPSFLFGLFREVFFGKRLGHFVVERLLVFFMHFLEQFQLLRSHHQFHESLHLVFQPLAPFRALMQVQLLNV